MSHEYSRVVQILPQVINDDRELVIRHQIKLRRGLKPSQK